MADEIFERAKELQEHLEVTPLNDLNPTGKELRSMIHVLTVGWGHLGEQRHVDIVETLLRNRGIIK
ncbi:MAG: hypothetical protein UT43_C0006G0009 [Parcubacteria group bacterium GW2011_GWC1_39_29]|nr:MAG: hypothetical protein UT43_C0006G0009 [Parcubacteria group bacterium GW2011_GWC1_39_29]HBT80722.1 hypothetical protein [Candidatus Yanofskybacteria bacterium]